MKNLLKIIMYFYNERNIKKKIDKLEKKLNKLKKKMEVE